MSIQDNPTHYNAKREREKALKALEEAKKLNRPVIYLKQGETLEKKNKRKPNK